jgi:zinc transport system substrate-binding protein
MSKNIFLALITFFLASCSEKEPTVTDASPSEIPRVVTTNYPLFFFASEIAGESVEVSFPEIEGDPAMWAPDGQDAADLQDSDLLILNGAGYESWLAFTTLPGGHTLDTTAQVQGKLLPIENETVHQHGPGGEHSHQGTAFTTWLDPLLAIEQARAIKQGLSSLAPEQAGSFQSNFEKLEQRLTLLDESLARALGQLGEPPVVFSHPVYQYLQHRYGLNGRSVHWEPDTEPGTREWIDFGNLLRQTPARIMIWEDTPLESVREKLLEMDIQVIVFNPAGNTPLQGDYFGVMEKNILEVESVSGRPDIQTGSEPGK